MASIVFVLSLNGAVTAQPQAQAQAQTQTQAQARLSAGSAITPADAQRTVDILQDDTRRAELIQTLKTIAVAGPGAVISESTASTSTSAPAIHAGSNSSSSLESALPPGVAAVMAPTANTPANTAGKDSTAAPDTIVPLEAGGLIARALGSLDRWMNDFVVQLYELRKAAMKIPALLAHSRTLTTPAGQQLLGLLALTLMAAFAVGLTLEWGLHRVLRRARQSVSHHTDRLALGHARLHRSPDAASPASPHPKKDASQAGLQPTAEGVAIVQSHRDGIDLIETIPVGTENAAGSPPAPASAPSSPPRDPRDEKRQVTTHRHWSTLRNLPYAFGALILETLPIALFLVAASLVLKLLAGDDPRVTEAIGGFIEAYVALRLTMVVVRLLVSPADQGVRLLSVSPAMAQLFIVWIRRIVGLAVFGLAIADALPLLDTGGNLRLAFLKAVSLLVHLGAVIFILKLRRPVRDIFRAPPDAYGPLAIARNWLADVWAAIAIVFVMGVWFVWAMGVEDGFPKLIHFVVVSAAVLIGARLLTILILGALGRLFAPGKMGDNGADDSSADGATGRAERRLSDRYYPILRCLISLVMLIFSIIVLFKAWGIDSFGWFAPGTLGRSLTSAAITIIVAIVVATLIWEAAQYAVERRLDRWTALGDTVRAARLRTLLPMLRTALFVLIALIVGLTALNELGVNTTPLLAGASIVGVALGFGSQKLVQDFITGIFLLMENAMRVGDWVTVAGVSGSVEYLSIRTVRLRGGDGALYIVPFSSVSTVSNSNRGIGNAAVRISVAYDTDIGRVIQELKEIGAGLRGDPDFKHQILNDIEVWGVDSVDGSMVTVVGQMRCSDKGRWGVQREINRRILERFRELDIEIADPRSSLLVSADGADYFGIKAAAARST